jgi:glycosyltransferase involved in cell wall biosynthesis
LIVAGFQEVNHQEYLIKLVGELGLNSLVSFVGPTFGQDKIDLLSNASVFVFPSYNESFGIVVTEALGRGVPVLTTKGAPWSELETHNCGWWVENSEEGLMDGLNQVLKTDPKTLSLMGERGRALVLDKYTWEDNVKNTLELYNWLINNGKKPSFVA